MNFKYYRYNSIVMRLILFLFLIQISLLANEKLNDYKLTFNDKIQITYSDLDNNGNIIDKSDIFTIKKNGTINHPILGSINIAGYTISEAENHVLLLMEKFFTNPNITIISIEKNTVQVLLYGAVSNSGLFNINPQTNVAEFILGTGNLNNEADLTNIQIVSNNDSTIGFNLTNFLYNNDNTNNIILKNGTKIIVPTHTDRNFANIQSDNYILKEGNVIKISIFENSQGTMDESEPDILSVDEQGYIYHKLLGKLHIGGMTINNAEEQIKKEAINYYKEPIVKINVVSINKRVVYIFGEISNPGYHPLIGSIRISEFIAKYAGGFSKSADINKILISRKNGKILTFNFKDFLYKRKDEENVFLKDGDRIIVSSTENRFSRKLYTVFRGFYYTVQFLGSAVALYLLIDNFK